MFPPFSPRSPRPEPKQYCKPPLSALLSAPGENWLPAGKSDGWHPGNECHRENGQYLRNRLHFLGEVGGRFLLPRSSPLPPESKTPILWLGLDTIYLLIFLFKLGHCFGDGSGHFFLKGVFS